MEAVAAIGLVASLATLLRAAKALVEIVQRIPHASNEARIFNEAASSVLLHVRLLQKLTIDAQPFESAVSTSDKDVVISSIRQAECRLQSVAENIRTLTEIPEWKLRWKWVLTNSAQAKAIMRDLASVETTLILTLTIFNS